MSGYYWTMDGRHLFRLLDGERTNGYSGPYVVIDPEDETALRNIAALLMKLDRSYDDDSWLDLRDALREYANPKPQRPDEPQWLGAVVEDEDGNLWVRTLPGRDVDASEWIAGFPSDPKLVSYDRIAAVRVLSPGVEAS